MLKREKVDLSEERRILSFMITSTQYLTQLKGVAQPKLFQSSYSKIIAEWVWEYFDHTLQAPERAIEEIFLKKTKEIQDEDDRDLIITFLQNLSADWEKAQVHNIPYTVKNAVDYFKVRSLALLQDKLDTAVKNNDSALGERLLSEYKNVDRPKSEAVDLIADTPEIIRALTLEDEFLFSFPGELGHCIGPLMRGDFLAIMAPPKRGKTHYLWYTTFRAMTMGMRAVFVSLEMTKKQMLRRMWRTVVGKPIKEGTYSIPVFEDDADGMFKISHDQRHLKALDPADVGKKQAQMRRYLQGGNCKLLAFPSGQCSVQDIETELNNLEYYENFIPDVVVVDYADLLKAPGGISENRHKLDDIWKNLRGIAQKRNILMVTGSQSGRQSMNRDVKAQDVAEDIRKVAHITKMFVLNQSEKEMKDGIMRVETTTQREDSRFVGQVIVLQNYDIGRAYLDSRIKNTVNIRDEEKKDNEKDE